jgi:hypothetical protein
LILYTNKTLRYCEVWFDESPDTAADIVMWRQRGEAMPGARCEPFHTLLVDLSLPQDALLAAIHKDSRYEIRRAEKSDGVVAEHYPQPAELLAAFQAFYNAFAQQKGLPLLDPLSLQRSCHAGHLVLSRIMREGEPILWHAYYCASNRARLLYSASLFRDLDSGQRNLIGRANRYLHWRDMLNFKAAGFHTYDLGGWSPPETGDAEKLRINQFKEEFGGQLAVEFNCVYPASFKGRVACAVKRLLRRR